jgi:hypothetical protein
MSEVQKLEDFYHSLQTLPKLISDLALSVAEAQRRMDLNYIQELTAFFQIVSSFYKKDGNAVAPPPDQLLNLFKAMGPSRYQFSETIIETRADLQMTTGTQAQIGGSLGMTAPFAVSVNASYTRRNATDYRASAFIRIVLQAVSADPGVMEKLLAAAKDAPGAPLPDDSRFKALSDAFSGFASGRTAAEPAKVAAGEQPAAPPAEPKKP